jgi:hypothetical protein
MMMIGLNFIGGGKFNKFITAGEKVSSADFPTEKFVNKLRAANLAFALPHETMFVKRGKRWIRNRSDVDRSLIEALTFVWGKL